MKQISCLEDTKSNGNNYFCAGTSCSIFVYHKWKELSPAINKMYAERFNLELEKLKQINQETKKEGQKMENVQCTYVAWISDFFVFPHKMTMSFSKPSLLYDRQHSCITTCVYSAFLQ
jgi:hypothetical protein